MTKAEFLELLKKHNINENIVVFDDAIKDGYCIRKNYFRWEVFYRERGKEYECIGFPSESDALQYLFDKLYNIYVKRYFYITIHFSPDYEGTVFKKHQDDLYINTETREIYRKRLLYDFGWGQENGFELMPQLPFNDLIKLIERPMVLPKSKFLQKYSKEEIRQTDIWRSNLYGAVAVIMQDYVEELIEFLYAKVDTDYFSNPSIRENFKCFSFDSQKTRAEGKIPGGVMTRTYEDILNDYPQWKRISSKVINQVYV